MTEYSTRDVADLLGIEPKAVRRYAKSAALDPERCRGERYGLSFQDMVLIRTAAELSAGGIPPHRIHQSLRRLREQLPPGKPLAAVSISTDGGRLLVQDGSTVWSPESGQVYMELKQPAPSPGVTRLERRQPKSVRRREPRLTAEDWYEFGCACLETAPEQAAEAFTRALEMDPGHGDAHVNLGYLLQEQGDHADAEVEYGLALKADPPSATAAYNLGVVLEDRQRPEEAVAAYELAIQLAPDLADAHFNLSRLSEELGDRPAALRHLRSYSRLLRANRNT